MKASVAAFSSMPSLSNLVDWKKTPPEAMMITVLSALSFSKGKLTCRKDRAMITAAVMRRIRHNDDIKGVLLKIFTGFYTGKRGMR